MFLAGIIVGITIGILIIKLHMMLSEMDEGAKRMAEDAKATYKFWKDRRKVHS